MGTSFYKNLLQNEHGAILPIFGVLVLMMVVIGGAAIDVSRAVNAREKLSYAIDAAALAVATDLSTSVMTDDEITQAIEDSFRANLANAEFLDKAIENLNFVVDSDEGTINISSSASLSTYFLDVGGYGLSAFGPDAFNFGTSAQVAYSKFDIELALILDVTGSMGVNPNDIASLRTASTELINILFPESASSADSKIRVSIVPYSQGVNLGSYADTVTNGAAGWRNCVTERSGAMRLTDAIYNYNGATSDFFQGAGEKLFRNGSERSPWGEQCPDDEILPLTDNKRTLLSKIASLTDDNGTAGQTGVAWGWYTLSPSWASLWPAASAPAAYGSGNSSDDAKKFAVVMTDGNFNNYFDFVDYPETSCRWVWKGYWDRECTTTTNSIWTEYYDDNPSINSPSADRGNQYCSLMKDNNIEVYAIYFETTGSTFGEALMRNCASSSNNFYLAESRSDLIQAFSNIAKKIQNIYLSK